MGLDRLKECLKYAEELYFEGMNAHSAIAKAKKVMYGKW